MSTRYGIGREYDVNCKPEAHMKTSTSQYLLVGMAADTTTAGFTVGITDQTGTGGVPTATARHAIGINQSFISASSEICSIRMFGLSKATCAESITTGQWIKAYEGVSTTTMKGRIAAVANAVSCTVATTSITSHSCVVGRAMENGSTGTVISVFFNPQLYDQNLIT